MTLGPRFSARMIANAPKSFRGIDAVGATKVVALVLIVGSGYAAYERRKLVKSREAMCESVDDDANYKAAGFKLAKYRGTVLSREMIVTGLTERLAKFQTTGNDVIVASFPKSGTTWLQQVVYLLYNPPKYDEPPKDEDRAVMEWRFPYLEHVYPGLAEVDSRKSTHRPRLIKTHLPVTLLPDDLAKSGAKVVYIYRNPKDVAVSYYHFARMFNFAKYAGSLNDFAWTLMLDKAPYAPLFPHINGYVEAAASQPDRFLVLRYEDMKADPGRAIRKVAKFLGVDADDDLVEAVEGETTFEAMKRNPATNYDHWDTYGLRNASEARFMRKGQVGDYKNHFSESLDKHFDEWIDVQTKKFPLVKFKYDAKSSEND